MGGQVPAVVQLGVLAHADLGRLANLGRNRRLGSVRRAWGTEMARLAGDLTVLAATPERLAALQRDLLVPLELEALAGRAHGLRPGAVNGGHVTGIGADADAGDGPIRARPVAGG